VPTNSLRPPDSPPPDPNCPNCDGEGWVYEDDETIPFRGNLKLGPGVLCPVCSLTVPRAPVGSGTGNRIAALDRPKS
jgi:hypothetical protein